MSDPNLIEAVQEVCHSLLGLKYMMVFLTGLVGAILGAICVFRKQ